MSDTSHEDDIADFSFPTRPSDLRNLPDAELFTLWRKLHFANRYAFDRTLEIELTTRLISSLCAFKSAADRSARTLNRLTLVLVALTVVLVIYAIRAG